MNVQDYIESGIIESYVMGLATEPERAEFERLCLQYPELVAARRKFEESLEGYASENAAPPPPDVKAKVLEAVKMLPVRPEQAPGGNQVQMMLRLVTAACILLVAGMAFLYYQTRQENKALTNLNQRLKESLDTTSDMLRKIVDEQKVVSNPDITVVHMVGIQGAPESSANVYWDSARSDVYLVVRNMPRLPSDQQYQLWALIDKKPKDLGVFDATGDKVILKMKNTQKAQAFAITIEKKGGSTSPTMEKMLSSGKTMQSQ